MKRMLGNVRIVAQSFRHTVKIVSIAKEENKTMKHELKTWPVFYDDVEAGAKCFEIRKNDRNFEVGDILHLFKYIPDSQTQHKTGKFTGDSIMVQINYTIHLDAIPGMPAGFIGMGIELISEVA
jgi:hypothetical protein